MSRSVARKGSIVRKSRGRQERPLVVDAEEQMNLLAFTDDALKMLDTAASRRAEEIAALRAMHERLERARRVTVQTIALRERVA